MNLRLKLWLYLVVILATQQTLADNISSSSKISPTQNATELEDRLNRFSAGLLSSYFYYEEPRLMNMEGQTYGLQLNWEKLDLEKNNFFSLKASMQQGKVDYKGGLFILDNYGNVKTQPYTIDGEKVSVYKYSGFWGKQYQFEKLKFILQVGLNFYYLNDADDPDPYDYERRQRYFTTPLRIDYFANISDNFLRTHITYHPNLTFSGRNESILDGNTLVFTQRDGSGLEVGFDYIMNNVSLSVLWESWSVGASSKNQGFVEPENTTQFVTVSGNYLF